MEEILRFQLCNQTHSAGSYCTMEDFSISREELLSCWEKCDSTIWNIIRGSSPKYKVLCDAIQDCIRLKYGFNVYKTDLEAALDEMNERSYAGYRGIFGICPWETVALRPYTRRIQHAKERIEVGQISQASSKRPAELGPALVAMGNPAQEAMREAQLTHPPYLHERPIHHHFRGDSQHLQNMQERAVPHHSHEYPRSDGQTQRAELSHHMFQYGMGYSQPTPPVPQAMQSVPPLKRTSQYMQDTQPAWPAGPDERSVRAPQQTFQSMQRPEQVSGATQNVRPAQSQQQTSQSMQNTQQLFGATQKLCPVQVQHKRFQSMLNIRPASRESQNTESSQAQYEEFQSMQHTQSGLGGSRNMWAVQLQQQPFQSMQHTQPARRTNMPARPTRRHSQLRHVHQHWPYPAREEARSVQPRPIQRGPLPAQADPQSSPEAEQGSIQGRIRPQPLIPADDRQKFRPSSSPRSITSSEAADAIEAYEDECDEYKNRSFTELEMLRYRLELRRSTCLAVLRLPNCSPEVIREKLSQLEMSLAALNRAWHSKMTQTGTRDRPIGL